MFADEPIYTPFGAIDELASAPLWHELHLEVYTKHFFLSIGDDKNIFDIFINNFLIQNSVIYFKLKLYIKICLV